MKYLLLLLLSYNLFAIDLVSQGDIITAAKINEIIEKVNNQAYFVGSIIFRNGICDTDSTTSWTDVCNLNSDNYTITGNITNNGKPGFTATVPAGHLQVTISTGLVDKTSSVNRLSARLFDSVHNIASSAVTVHTDNSAYTNSGSMIFDIIIPEAGTYTFNLQVIGKASSISYIFRTDVAPVTISVNYEPMGI